MKKVLAALAASGVLVAGGFTAAAVSTPTSAQAQDQDETATVDRPDKGAALDEVFAELVVDGVISQEQADAVRAALEAKRDELREQFGDRRDRGHRAELRALLEDGVIDSDELAGLPEGHPLTDPDGPFAGALEDGQITIEELEELRGEFRSPRRGFARGGFGAVSGESA